MKRLLILSNSAAASPAARSFSITMETAFGLATEITSELCVTVISTLTWLSAPTGKLKLPACAEQLRLPARGIQR